MPSQITELDRRLAHSSMPLNEEKKIMAEIERLKASRAIVASYEDLLKETDALDKEADSIRDQMKQCSDDMDAVNKRSVQAGADFSCDQINLAELEENRKPQSVPELVLMPVCRVKFRRSLIR